MAESSRPTAATSSNLESLVLRKLAHVKNSTVAQAIGHDDGHISRIASGERGVKLPEMEQFFQSLGLRLIECDGLTVSLPANELEALRILARKALS